MIDSNYIPLQLSVLFKKPFFSSSFISIFSIEKPNGRRVTGWTDFIQPAFYLK
jgi:hypothetical protein